MKQETKDAYIAYLRDGLNEYQVPAHMHDALILWITDGIMPGSFLTSVLDNDLREAVARADYINQGKLKEIISFLYNVAPGPCWGSPEKVVEWYSEFHKNETADVIE